MPVAPANGIEVYYETFGDAGDPALLLVNGLGGQCLTWAEELCEGFVDRGFFVLRYDNRDVGLSSRVPGSLDVAEAMARLVRGEAVDAPYLLADMAADAVGLLDHLGVQAAHVLGASMGGMIAQQLAMDRPGRVLSLTSLMSTTGEPEVGQPRPEALELMALPPPEGREEAIDRAVVVASIVGSPDRVDEERVRSVAGAQFDRAFDPDGVQRQLIAIVSSPSRAEGLVGLRTPTLVVHGTEDLLVDPSGGRRTAELVPGARLELVEGLGHDLPVPFWSHIIELVTRHAASASAETRH
ncbi:MAG: alpha/beta fold hydrolase [Acidimicrobiia bacterium]|nr:alpha/beta fold hydrolase [Acidimicrobiia bacterium]